MRPVRSTSHLLIGCTVVAAAVAVYLPVWTFAFVNFDDPDYVLDVPILRHGISWDLVRWVCTHAHARLWHPLTTLSHALDWSVWGDFAGGHHLTNVLLHAVDVALLFAILARLTGAPGRSLAAALLWGLHPLRVESVAWVAERKDVLSGAGFLLTVAAYGAWAARPTARRYALLVLAFGAALLAKSTVVTLPAILLLLDVWPLRRAVPLAARVRALAPLAALAAAASAITIAVQHAGGAVAGFDMVPLPARLTNAAVAGARYLFATIWPTRLAVFYPYGNWDDAAVLGAVLVLVATSVLAWRLRETRPYLLVGWGWWLLALLPVIGIVQAGSQSMADRFTYLPAMGLTIAVVWAAADALAHRPRGTAVGGVLTAALVLVAVVLTRRQLVVWRDSETLFTRALAVTDANYLAHNNLGQALADRSEFTAAAAHYAEAVRLNPIYAPAQLNLGNALLREHRLNDAEPHLRAAVSRRPDQALAWNSLGVLLASRGRFDDAVAQFERSLTLAPDYAEAEGNLGDALRRQGRLDAAATHLRRATALRPEWPDAQLALGETLLGLGDLDGAAACFREVLRLDPASGSAHYGLANVLYRQERPADAVGGYREALRLRPDWPEARDNLGIALLAAGDAAAAVDQFSENVRVRPEDPQARFHLGLALAASGRPEEAGAALREALRLRPGWPDATRALADVESPPGR